MRHQGILEHDAEVALKDGVPLYQFFQPYFRKKKDFTVS